MTDPERRTTDELAPSARDHTGDPEVKAESIEDLDAAPDADEIHGGKCTCLSDDVVWGTRPH